jgi:vacuolar-type H+-ATPase subunit I/STV1
MELPQVTARKFVLDDFARRETIETETEGPKQFQIRYALLEFPEAVDQIAVRQIRQSIQQDRIMGLGVVVGFAWLSVSSAGFGIRQWRKGTKLRRIAAAPLFALITLPTLLLAIGMVLALTKGDVPHRPWNSKPVTIDLQNV